MRDAHKIKDKPAIRVDVAHLVGYFLALVAMLAGAFYGGLVVERSYPDWTWWPWRAEPPVPRQMTTLPGPPEATTTPLTVDAVMPVEASAARHRPAQAAVPAHGRGWVPPAEMGPRPLSSVEYVDEVEVEHAGSVGGAASSDEGTLDMPAFVLDTASDDAPAYTLQVKAFREEQQADVFLAELRTKGYDAWLVHSDIPEKGVWYRVRVGHFSTLAEATGFQATFDDKENLSTFVSSL